MFDTLVYFLFSYGILAAFSLFVLKFVLFLTWESRRKRFSHLLYIDAEIAQKVKSTREAAVIKAQNYIGLVIVFLLMFWIFLKALLRAA